MTWDRSEPVDPKYRSPEHRRTRERLMAQLKREGFGRCAEPVCIGRSRIITPEMRLHLSHKPDGVTYAGLSHEKCNLSAAGRRARRGANGTFQRRGVEPRLSPIW